MFIPKNTHTFKELLPNKSKQIFRVHIKHYWYLLERVTFKQYDTLFQSLHKAILIFSELPVTGKQYYTLFQSLYILSNTDIFRDFLPN